MAGTQSEHRGLLSFPPRTPLLSYLIVHQLAISCPLVKVDDFVSYCRDRGLDTSKNRLEQLERLGVLYPIARSRHFIWKEKFAPAADGAGFLSAGELGADEEWEGPVQRREWHLTWASHHCPHLATYLEEGRLWAPSEREFQPWDTMVDEEGYRDTESFYSIFQLYTLHFLQRVAADRQVLRVADIWTWTDDQRAEFGVSLGQWADGKVQDAATSQHESRGWLGSAN